MGKEKSTLELQIPLRNSGAGSLVRNYEHEPHEKYEIEIVSVDDSFLNNETPVKFMKIDVENFEYFVLTGANQTIRKYKPAIYLEISGKEKNARNEIVDFLRERGYSLFTEDGNNYVPFHQSESIIKAMDLLAIHETHSKNYPFLKHSVTIADEI